MKRKQQFAKDLTVRRILPSGGHQNGRIIDYHPGQYADEDTYVVQWDDNQFGEYIESKIAIFVRLYEAYRQRMKTEKQETN